MNTYLIAAIIVLVGALGLLVFSFVRPNFREILIGIALLMGAIGGAFLSEYFVKKDQLEGDRVTAWVDLRRYAMSEVLLRYVDMDNLVKQLSSSKSVNETSDYLLKLSPLPVYDRLLRNGQLVYIVDNDLLVNLALTKAIELEFIKSIVTNKGVIEAQQLTNLHLYRNWLQDLWKQLCGNAINIVYERNSCTIEDGLQEIKPALESK